MRDLQLAALSKKPASDAPAAGFACSLSAWRRAGGRLRRAAAARLCAGVGNAPDRAAGVVADQQRAVLGYGQCRGPAPDFGAVHAGDPEAGDEVLVGAL